MCLNFFSAISVSLWVLCVNRRHQKDLRLEPDRRRDRRDAEIAEIAEIAAIAEIAEIAEVAEVAEIAEFAEKPRKVFKTFGKSLFLFEVMR